MSRGKSDDKNDGTEKPSFYSVSGDLEEDKVSLSLLLCDFSCLKV